MLNVKNTSNLYMYMVTHQISGLDSPACLVTADSRVNMAASLVVAFGDVLLKA